MHAPGQAEWRFLMGWCGQHLSTRILARSIVSAAALWLFLFSCVVVAEDTGATDPAPEQIQQWIEQLGDEDFQVREAANAKLYEAGEAALEALQTTSQEATEFEVRDRAKRTHDRIVRELYDAALAHLATRGIPLRARPPKYLTVAGGIRDGERVGRFVGDEDLRHVARITSFTRVKIIGSPITDQGLAHLTSLKNLEQLTIQRTKITDAGLVHLLEFPKLWSITLEDCNITDKGILTLAKAKNVSGLYLRGIKITDDGLAPLAKMPKLASVDFSNTQITGKGLAHLRPLKDQIIGIRMSGTPITDDDLAVLRDFKELYLLRLQRTSITGRGFAHLTGLPKLEMLNLIDSTVNDEACKPLSKFPALRSLQLFGTKVTPGGVVLLRDAPKLKRVHVPTEFSEIQVDKLRHEINKGRGEAKISIGWHP